ncbi:MAG: electron transfer flavoprotein subunit beta/FixA family protein [Acidobacteriota bacterium]
MKIAVCVKQVPDSEATLSIDAAKTGIVESGLSFEINGYDRYALEAALRFKDAGECQVVAVTIGPERAAQALKTCLATGADRAIHLKDPAFQGGDPWSNATALAAALGPESPDLILCGLQSDDLNLTQTPVLLAERLGVPHATAVMRIEGIAGGVRVERELENDRREVLELPFPALLAVQTGLNEPRYASIKGIMAAKKKELKALSPEDLGLEPAQVGRAGARIKFFDLHLPPKKEGGEILSGSSEEIAAELVKRIREHTGLI